MAERRRNVHRPTVDPTSNGTAGTATHAADHGSTSDSRYNPYHSQARASNGANRQSSPVKPPLPSATRNNKPQFQLGIWASRGLLMTVAGMYATNFATVKYLEQYCDRPPCNHDPSEAAFCRFLVSTIVCLPILVANRRHRALLVAGVKCGLWMTVNFVCQFEALEYIPAGKCAFIGALAVVTVPVLAALFLNKPIRPVNLVSAIVALLGVAILENVLPIGNYTTQHNTEPPAGAADNSTFLFGLGKGDILAMGQPIGFGYAVMLIEHNLEKHAHVPNRVLTMTAAQCVTVCLLAFVWVVTDRYRETGVFLASLDLSYMWEPHRLVALAWMGIVTTVGAVVLQGIALQKASATDAALIFSTEPVWGSIFAGWLLGEQLTATTYIGGAFILVACIVGSLGDVPKEQTHNNSLVSSQIRRQQFKSKHSSDSLHTTHGNGFFAPNNSNGHGTVSLV